jgi:hypothetical protein
VVYTSIFIYELYWEIEECVRHYVDVYVNVCACMYLYLSIYIHVYVYIYIERERERERGTLGDPLKGVAPRRREFTRNMCDFGCGDMCICAC